MQITMPDKVVQWYKEDLALTEGDFVKFYVRYGGFNSLIKVFSLGIDKEQPEQTHTQIRYIDIKHRMLIFLLNL